MAARIFARHPGSAVGFHHKIALEGVCSRVLWVRPDAEKKGEYDICVRPIPWVPDATQILSNIKAAVQDQSAAKQTKFFTVCCSYPGTRCAAGYIFQDRVHAFFSGSGKTLTWHSSPSMPHTVKIPDDEFVVEVTTAIRPAVEEYPSGIYFRPALANRETVCQKVTAALEDSWLDPEEKMTMADGDGNGTRLYHLLLYRRVVIKNGFAIDALF
jgi:hypothetical protein